MKQSACSLTAYLGNLILKDGKLQMCRFAGGYASFDADTIDGYHYYISDYQGNNRMVVNASTDEVEQVNHYYPYGGLIGDLCTGQEEQEFKFGDKKLDRTYGLDLYDFEARQYDAIAPWFTSIDPLAEKYYSISPYAYCAGDPVNCIDPDGRDLCVLLEPQGAGGAGHMAILIQKQDPNDPKNIRWYLYSKNGVQSSRDENGVGITVPSGPNTWDNGDNIATATNPITGEQDEVSFDSPQDFLDSQYNKNSDGNYIYQEGYTIESNKQEDSAARNAAIQEIQEPYNLVGSNCAYTVQKALEAAGKSSGHFNIGTDNGLLQLLLPNGRFRMITRENPGSYVRPKVQGQPKKIKL